MELGVKTAQPNSPSHHGLALGDNRQQGGQVVDGINVVLLDRCLYGRAVGYIDNFGWPRVFQYSLRLGSRYVSGNHMFVTITFAQLHREFRTYLSGGSNDQNILHTN